MRPLTGSYARTPHPDPCVVAAAFVSWALKPANDPNDAAIASASSPTPSAASGSPPPSPVMLCQ